MKIKRVIKINQNFNSKKIYIYINFLHSNSFETVYRGNIKLAMYGNFMWFKYKLWVYGTFFTYFWTSIVSIEFPFFSSFRKT